MAKTRTTSTGAIQVARKIHNVPAKESTASFVKLDLPITPHDAVTARRSILQPAPKRAKRQHSPDNLICVLQDHAKQRPDHEAFIYLRDGQAEEVFTYAQFDRRARAVAAHIQQLGLAGERVLLAYPPGLDFIIGYFGCLYAGSVAVPMYLPHRRTLDRFHAIANDAEARLVLSTAHALTQHQAMTEQRNGRKGIASPIPWLATDEIAEELAEQWKGPVIVPETLAMLQYTSGSTSQPKGVMISHGNLIQNIRDIFQAFEMEPEREAGVFWLPAYHDMGLVGGILEPIFAGVTSVLMAPAAFLQQPIAWLSAISKYRATITGAPNFAFELCARKITDEQRATLDLSCLSLVFVGAEPIQPETLERFAATFAPCGFKATAFYPCYGMAEATLMVSGAKRGSGPTIRAFDDTTLLKNLIEPVRIDAANARRLASCGTPIGDLRVRIVDSQTEAEVAPNRVGEIWVAGGSIGQGYWHKPDQTRQSFNAYFSDTGEGPFLRTGDMGFVHEGQLYVIGRQDDVLIVRGMNHHPQDLENAARMSHPLLEAGFGAAFAVDDERGQRLVLVHEVTRNGDSDYTRALNAVREAVLAEHGLALHTIALVRGGTIPRTSSGKVQRRACQTAYQAGELKTVVEYHSTAVATAEASSNVTHSLTGVRGGASTTAHSTSLNSPSFVLATVCQHAIALGGAALSDVTPDTPLTALGLDSLQRVELAAKLEKTFACRLSDAEFSPAQTLGELANVVHKRLNGHSHSSASECRGIKSIPPEHYDFVRFPEYGELKSYERMLKAVAGDNPYFRLDSGLEVELQTPQRGMANHPSTRIPRSNPLVSFGVYDYIGMAHDSQVAAAAKAAIDRDGTSAGASRLVSGEKQVHRDLEQAIAAFLGTAAAIVFVSGHATNVTTIGHLFGPEDLIVHDVLAHNSIIQGAQLSGATRRVFAHNDWQGLDVLLTEVRHRYRRVLIAIEGVYSMDGDFPDLPRFVDLKKKHKTLILVDEAHSLGTMGQTGRGIGEHFGVARTDVDLWMGTLSKSLASCGGYIAGSAEVIEYLKYTVPGFVYSVGLSPPNAAAALAALSILQTQPERVSRLRELSAMFLNLANERGLNTGSSSGTPVIPVIVGNSVKSLRVARALFERGINVHPILHPAVPEHSARLRFFVTTNHSELQIRETVSAVAEELDRL